MDKQKLIDSALKARESAKADYSGFKVGASIQCSNGSIVNGCNVESASYGLTICAERAAIFNALAQGFHKDDFVRMAIVVDSGKPAAPCGACRQVIWEWAPDIEIICATLHGDQEDYNIRDLLPNPFDSKNIR